MTTLTKDDDSMDLAVFDNNNLFLIMVAEKLQISYSFKFYQRQRLDSA